MKDHSILRENLRLLVRKLGLLEETEAKCCQISLAQCHALVEIGRAGSLSLNTLADQLNLDKSTMSRTLNQLVENDFALRESSPNDRRYVEIQLTDKGMTHYLNVEKTGNHYFNKVLENIPSDKQLQVFESIHLLCQALEKTDHPERCCGGDL